MNKFDDYVISLEADAGKIMKQFGENRRGFAMVLDSDRHLISTVTDGDVRRAFLRGITLESGVSEILAIKEEMTKHAPITAAAGKPHGFYLDLMRKHDVNQLPLLDEKDQVVEVAFRDDLVSSTLACRTEPLGLGESPAREPLDNLLGVIMAGGFGKRLRPLTDDLPKPMLPISGRPLLEIIIGRFREHGISDLFVSTHYLKEVIEDYFEDGCRHGVSIRYLNEEKPAGTAGALALVEDSEADMVVMNGDLLTEVDLRSMVEFHRESGAALTVGVRQYDMAVPYGVIQSSGEFVTGIEEKPTINFLVNAGVYVVSAGARAKIPADRRFDMTDLLEALLQDQSVVVSFPIMESWLDIGHIDDYRQAQKNEENQLRDDIN